MPIYLKKIEGNCSHLCFLCGTVLAQKGFYDAPYKRCESNLGLPAIGALISLKSYVQTDLQSEASDQQCLNLDGYVTFVTWVILIAAETLRLMKVQAVSVHFSRVLLPVVRG